MYTDETWVNAHNGQERTWLEYDDITGATKQGIRNSTGIIKAVE